MVNDRRIIRDDVDLTDEERAAPTWMELDDACLAGMVRGIIEQFDGQEFPGVFGLPAHAAFAVGVALEANASEYRQTIENVTIAGEPVGDWEIVVRRTDGSDERNAHAHEEARP